VYVFAVGMTEETRTVKFALPGVKAAGAEAIGEDRKVAVKDGGWSEEFKGYEVHLYKIAK